ncbi:MAG: glycosyl transferase family 2, partial [Chloroflexota bacterium]
MPFLTIFTAPKPFTDPHINIIQRNAIQSWMHLSDDVEVILVGEEDGLASTAAEFGLKHLPNVARNEWNTPLVSSIFDLARTASQSPVLAYVNADILLLQEFLSAARKVTEQVERFLVVGQRWDFDLSESLDFSPDWDQRLRKTVQEQGSLHAPAGSDYFIFSRTIFTDMPDFAIGRAGWDNWMIYSALQQGWPVVDGTKALMVIHQNHDYSHLPEGKIHYDLEETKINAALGGGMRNMYMTLDSSH